MPKSRLPKVSLRGWCCRVCGLRAFPEAKMTYGRSLERHLKRTSLPLAYTEWACITQNRAELHKRATKPPFTTGKPFLRRPRGDNRRTAEQKHEDKARRTAEIAERRTVLDANDNDEGRA